MLRSAVLLLAIGCLCVRAVEFEDCGSLYDAEGFDIEGCSAEPCNVVIGSTARITVRYTAEFQSDSLYKEVYVRMNGINVFLSVTPEPCADGSGTVCPVKEGITSQYTADVTFSESLLPLPANLFWRMYNDAGSDVLCFRVPIRPVTS